MGVSFTCFSCGGQMRMIGALAGWCDRCQVVEEQEIGPYFCRTRRITSEIFRGEVISYLDHSSGHYPSPA